MTIQSPVSRAVPGLPKTPKAPHPLLALPFVRDATKNERRAGAENRLFWSVTPSGDYTEDCNTGTRYAALAMEYMAESGSPYLLTWAVDAMLKNAQPRSGLEVGFLETFGREAIFLFRLRQEVLARDGRQNAGAAQ